MNDQHRDIERVLEELAFDDAPDQAHQDLLEKQLLLNFSAVRSRQASQWRIVMNKNMARLAAAAVIVIGVFVGYVVFTRTGSVSWAQVRRQVAAARAVAYKGKITSTGGVEGEFRAELEGLVAEDYGTRMDAYVNGQLMSRSFALTNERTFVTLFPGQKKYSLVDLTEENRRENADPKLLVERFLQGDYRPLGRREVDGIILEGIESNEVSPLAAFPGTFIEAAAHGEGKVAVVGRLWVNVATGWPVEVTLDITRTDSHEKTVIVVSDFQWDAEVTPEMFSAGIPDGYKLLYKVEMGRLESGEQLVEGLAYFAKINGGKYPATLSVRDIVGEVGRIYSEARAKSTDGRPALRIDDDQIINLKMGAAHVGKLEAEGKECVYYGQTVTAADANRVLLRWKLDEGRYRVIFGDLRIEDVSPARLAELEAE